MSKTTLIYPSKDTFVCLDENSKSCNFGKYSNLLLINTFITFDNLRATINAWYSNGSCNHGFELSTLSDSTLSFFSK